MFSLSFVGGPNPRRGSKSASVFGPGGSISASGFGPGGSVSASGFGPGGPNIGGSKSAGTPAYPARLRVYCRVIRTGHRVKYVKYTNFRSLT